MSYLPRFRVHWQDALYTSALQAQVNAAFAADSSLEAIVSMRRAQHIPGSRNFTSISDLSGTQILSSDSSGVMLKPAAKPLFSGLDETDHLYENHLWFGVAEGQQWLTLLHKEIILVLPGYAKDRRCIDEVEKDAMAFMKRPVSAHEKLVFPERLQRIAEQAAGMLSYTWEGGITLRDVKGILPDQFVDLLPEGGVRPRPRIGLE
jgi:hypothetical protein